MGFLLYLKCVSVLAQFLCQGDSMCVQDYIECVTDGESIYFCAEDMMLEYDPNTSMYCVKEGETYLQ